MLNDNAAKFACAQANCSTTNSIQPLFTVCMFDQPPTNPPYIVGGAGACDQTQCPSTRNTCDMNNLCCKYTVFCLAKINFLNYFEQRFFDHDASKNCMVL